MLLPGNYWQPDTVSRGREIRDGHRSESTRKVAEILGVKCISKMESAESLYGLCFWKKNRLIMSPESLIATDQKVQQKRVDIADVHINLTQICNKWKFFNTESGHPHKKKSTPSKLQCCRYSISVCVFLKNKCIHCNSVWLISSTSIYIYFLQYIHRPSHPPLRPHPSVITSTSFVGNLADLKPRTTA